jgi:GNAT superfamily N-acetyltransferase
MSYRLVSFQAGLEGDFYGLHCPANEAGWCNCVAWWVDGWDGWAERTAEQNRQLRQGLLAEDEYDGYLLYEDEKPIAWCQVGRRDRLVKLVNQMQLEAEPDAWAITCFLVDAAYRRQGVAGRMLMMVLADLAGKGIGTVEAYPKRGEGLDVSDLWNGPETMFAGAGFVFVKEAAQRAVWRFDL